jgi:hypothetical protein
MSSKNATGGGSQDSIDSSLTIQDMLLWLLWQMTDKRMGELMEDPKALEFIAKTEAAILAWHNTQLKKAIPEKRKLFEPVTKRPVGPGGKAMIDLLADREGSLIFIQDNGYNQAIDDLLTNLEEQK